MKKLFLCALLLLSFFSVFAQTKQSCYDRIYAVKVAYLTNRLHLTSQQAKRFWPIYDDYEKEHWAIRKSFFKKYREQAKDDNMSDEAIARQYVDDNLDYQEQELALKRKYKDQLLRTITAKQLAELYMAERDFKQMLLQKLKERKNDDNDGSKWHH